jgi:hypothetical protein
MPQRRQRQEVDQDQQNFNEHGNLPGMSEFVLDAFCFSDEAFQRSRLDEFDGHSHAGDGLDLPVDASRSS